MPDRLTVNSTSGSEWIFDLEGGAVVIGSDPQGAICLPEEGRINSKHAYLAKEDSTWQLLSYDASPISTEGRTVTDLVLSSGTEFGIGDYHFKFTSDRVAVDYQVVEDDIEDPLQAAADLHAAEQRIVKEMARIVIGQNEVVRQILVVLFARGHCLLLGTPGLAKTLMAKALAGTIDLQCKRVQFTPDLMPADITGTEILEEEPGSTRRLFRFKKGPIFTNLLLADEINRTPPKTQAALLEAMQERRVTMAGQSYDLPSPFFVIATQNPIEQEGTYTLPEAQLDRFMFCVKVSYPVLDEEVRIIMETTQDATREVERVLTGPALLSFQHLVRQAPVSQHVGRYAAQLVRASRPGNPDTLDFVQNWVRLGAGPRAGQYLLLAAKAHALLSGRLNVSCEDVRAYALPVLRHRILCNFSAGSEGVDSDEIIRRLIVAIPEPDSK